MKRQSSHREGGEQSNEDEDEDAIILAAARACHDAAQVSVGEAKNEHFFVRFRAADSFGVRAIGHEAYCIEPKRGPPRDWTKQYSLAVTAQVRS